MITSSGQVLAELLLLFLIALPLGALVLRLGERMIGRRVALRPVERVVIAFYASGAILFVVASLPIGFYSLATVVLLFLIGAVGYAVMAFREHGTGLRIVARFAVSPLGLALLFGTVGLLFLEIVPIWSIPLSNSYDGGMTSLWTTLTLANHTLPWTLSPYADFGITYPLATTVWMTLPALLFGWAIPQIPLLLVPLFLALTVPVAYALGERLSCPGTRDARILGGLSAVFFGLLASWPRLFVGGSYDFGVALPLLLLLIGWARPFVEGPVRSWREIIGLGLLLGVLASLSAPAAQFFLLFILGCILAFRVAILGSLGKWLVRWAVIGLVGMLFLLRTIVGYAIWFQYPGHVLQESGAPPYVPPSIGYSLSARLVNGELNPFVPWKAKLSPSTVLSVELQVLLAMGLILLALWYATRKRGTIMTVPVRAAQTVSVGLIVAFLFTGLLIVPLLSGFPAPSVEWLSSLDEISVILFIFYGLVALLPLLTAASLLDARRDSSTPGSRIPPSATPPPPVVSAHRPKRTGSRGPSRPWVSALLVLLIVVPLASGAVFTATGVPGYIQSKTLSTGDPTAQDLDALEWAGAHLPTCSRVLVAPGSAAQFLPEFGTMKIVYPMLPDPVNLTYHTVVEDLIAGSYNVTVRSALLTLDVSEIMATGETFDGFPPFNLTGILAHPAPDFQLLFSEGDAVVLEFVPGANLLNCAP